MLLKRIEESPFSEWNNLMGQVVRAAEDCQGKDDLCFCPTPWLTSSLAFTAEQTSQLSDILEAALPRMTSSPMGRAPSTIDSTSRRMNPLQPSRKGNVNANVPSTNNTMPYGDLAKEFGVDANLVEALIRRLSDFS